MAATIFKNCSLPGKTGLFSVEVQGRKITSVTRQEGQEQTPTRSEIRVIDGQGNYLLGGLWDEHVHVDLEAQEQTRIDLRSTQEPDDVLAIIGDFIAGLRAGRVQPQIADPQVPVLVQASGFRPSGWSREATVAELDQVTGDIPVLMISGDAHSGWLNSACQQLLETGPYSGLIREQEWFELMAQVPKLPDYQSRLRRGMETFLASACEKGLVGIRDMTFGLSQWQDWPVEWCQKLSVEVASYPDQFVQDIATGITTGSRLPDLDLGLRQGSQTQVDIVQGPLKIISDGSLGTETAYCCHPYASGDHGVQNYSRDELRKYLRKAAEYDFEIAVHGIGDAALEDIISVCEELREEGLSLHGSLEHVQLLAPGQAQRIANLGLVASVQPAHLLDDYPLALKIWADRMDRCYLFKDLEEAGVTVRLGSDAPVAALDPWLAMAAAVYRGPANPAAGPAGEADSWEWNPKQRLTVASALRASTRGHQMASGFPADLILVNKDPFLGTDGEVSGREYAQNLLQTKVLCTMRAGIITYGPVEKDQWEK